MIRKVTLAGVIVAAALVCFGCGQIPMGTSRNDRLCPTQVDCTDQTDFTRHHADEKLARTRSEFEPKDGFQPKVFVGLAISGGGSRAANFGLAAMEQLEQLGMLQHVTAISSTSGGGLPAAYYALNGAQMQGKQGEKLWAEAKQRMAHDFRDEWLLNWLLPWNLAKTSFTHADRSEVMADIFDKRLFNGATFSQLSGPPSPRRPMWIANATRIGGGSNALFTFTEESFRDIGSDLSSFPVSAAVMASAAFPGAFNSMTLHRYPLVPEVILEKRGPFPDGYVHLMDGGPADNLGVESLLKLASSTAYATPIPGQAPAFGPDVKLQHQPPVPCFIIVVDGYPDGVPDRSDFSPDPRGFKDHLLDTNFVSAFDAFLARRRNDFLALAGLRIGEGLMAPSVPLYVPMKGFGRYYPRPASRFSTVEFPLPARLQPRDMPASEGVANLDLLPQIRPARPCPDARHADPYTCRAKSVAVCSVWHIDLDGIASMPVARKQADGTWKRTSLDDEAFDYRIRLRWVTAQINTDFKLIGPPGCSSQFLQDAVYAAARVAIREDDQHRLAACDWFTRNGLVVAPSCKEPLEPIGQRDLQVSIASNSPPIPGTQRVRNQAVKCVAPAEPEG